MSTHNSTIILETTPRVYYEHYTKAAPNYDLYPGLSRRLGNGYVHRPIRPTRPQKKQQTDFMHVVNRRTEESPWQPQPQPIQQEPPSWDLYPSVLRNVENFGTDQMRQRLHAMETTLSTT